jgi:preprotein translocase subunit SecA
MDIPFDETTFSASKTQHNIDVLYNAVLNNYRRRYEKLASIVNPVVQDVYEKQGSRYENILIPITDGKRVYNITVNLKKAAETQSKEVVRSFEKAIVLHTIDEAWKENLRELDDLKTSVQNASYEQKDPLLIYKLESFNLFQQMIDNINRKMCTTLMRGQIPSRNPESVRQAAPEHRQDFSQYRTRKDDIGSPASTEQPSRNRAGQPQTSRPPEQPTQPIRVEHKINRNDPCPCGSGKKYKNCHGKDLL